MPDTTQGIAIVGPGLIGTSVALAARRADPDTRVLTLDRGDSLDTIAGADLVVLATPVEVIIDLLRNAAHRFRDLVVTDVGSTKRAIVAAARESGVSHFVGGHPMAGATTAGPATARADLFDGRPWFLVPSAASPQATARVQEFVTGLGARVTRFDDDGTAHDRIMAAVSHLPQVVAAALMKIAGEAVGPEGLRWAGPGCRDTTRLAASSASMWESVLATKADQLRPLLQQLAGELAGMAERLDDAEAVRRLFEAANRQRRALEAASLADPTARPLS